MKRIIFFFIACSIQYSLRAEDGYRLWLRYDKIDDKNLLSQYRSQVSFIHFTDSTPVLLAAKEELLNGLEGLLDKKIIFSDQIQDGTILAGTVQNSNIHSLVPTGDINKIGKEGFLIR